MVTYEKVKNDSAVKTYILAADDSLRALGYTEHSFGHVVKVAECAGDILERLGYDAHTVELTKIAGMLHDVIEDTDITIDYLREQGFPENILFAIDCLTRREGENYQDFIVRCCQSKIAMRVKIADLEDNLDMRRLKHITEKDIERINRYLEARRYLCNMLAYQVNP